jgi:hypothetical protein
MPNMRQVGTVIAGVLVLLILIVAVLTYRPGPDDRLASEQCRAAYHQARTAAESSVIDRVRNVNSRRGAVGAVNCGTLRSSGRIRP